MAQGIDFTGLIRGQQMADNANWANIRRIQDQDTYAIQREEQLAKQQQQRQGREASTYLSTILPNLQRYADQGLNPVDALINQREAIQNDQAFQGMSPEVQTQILNGLGQTASLHMQALKNSGDYTNLQKLVSTFGGTNTVKRGLVGRFTADQALFAKCHNLLPPTAQASAPTSSTNVAAWSSTARSV